MAPGYSQRCQELTALHNPSHIDKARRKKLRTLANSNAPEYRV